MDTLDNWFTGLVSKLLLSLGKKAIDSIDFSNWLDKYGGELVNYLLNKLDTSNLDDRVQDKILDPIKEWIEDKMNVNL